jgi:hypothetical protein
MKLVIFPIADGKLRPGVLLEADNSVLNRNRIEAAKRTVFNFRDG